MITFGNILRGRAGRRIGAMALTFVAMTMVLLDAELSFAQGGQLAVAPTRVVFEGRSRSAQLSLVNKGAKTATFRIRVVNLRMDENGGMQEIDKPDPDQQFAGKLFRYSPRQVTLKPGASQAIRLLLRKPKGLADGEYRSHLMMQNVPDESGVSLEQSTGGDGVDIKLVPVFGISIPVIVRHGNTATQVSLSGMNVVAADEQNKLPRLKFTIGRQGNKSAFGDLIATHVAGGNRTVVGQIMRLAVYTPNMSRTVMLPLRVPDGAKLSGGTINLTFSETEEAGGKLMGEASLSVP